MLADPEEILELNPPRHDSEEALRRTLNLGLNVMIIIGDQLAIDKETGCTFGMGKNMYPSSSLFGEGRDKSIAGLPVNELIEEADGFAVVFPGRCRTKRLFFLLALPFLMAVIVIAVGDATDAARGASDIVFTKPGLGVIISAVLTSRHFFRNRRITL
ncbi:hypothetical protein OROMI_031281 [Orobanche minor]